MTLALSPSVTQTQIQTLLRAYLLGILPSGIEVVIGQENRVSEPDADNFVIMWPTLRKRLATTLVTWNRTDPLLTSTESVRVDIQLDFHGADSTDNAQVFAALFWSPYATQFYAGSGMQPNYCSDGNQAPFINGEQQYEDRWTLTATFDANMSVQTPQQFANEIDPQALPVVPTFGP
jgi:hypothetical protein